MKAMDLANVFMEEQEVQNLQLRLKPGATPTFQVHYTLDEVIRTMAVLKPSWRFSGSSTQLMTNDPLVFSLCKFEVMEDGELLGTISRQCVSRNRDYKIVVDNPRIMAGRQRGQGYSTDDPKKAIVKVKRTFGRKSAKERLDNADKAAADYLNIAVYNHSSNRSEVNRIVRDTARDWVMGEGFEKFMEHVQEMPEPKKTAILTAGQKAEHLKAEMSILEDIRSRLGTQKSALIVRDMDQYIVRVGDNVQLHDDNTLPIQLRGRLGMLKLVDKEHFIEGAGSRVTDEVFVVLVDEEIPNTVSKGDSDE